MKIDIFVENPAGTTKKKEFNERTKKWEKRGNLATPYPFPYGFVPDTLQDDGDPLDVFLVTNNYKNISRGDTFVGEVIGSVDYYEDGERDFKILAKRLGEKYKLTAQVKKKLKYYFIHAFDNRPEKTVEFGGFKGIKAAEIEIQKCYEN